MRENFNQELERFAREQADTPGESIKLVVLVLVGGGRLTGVFLDVPRDCDYFLFEGSLVGVETEEFLIFHVRYASVVTWAETHEPRIEFPPKEEGKSTNV